MKIIRWIGVALLPFPVAVLIGTGINLFVVASMNIIFGNVNLSFRTAQIMSSIPTGAIIPFLAGVIAPTNKRTTAIVVASISSFIIFLLLLLSAFQGNYFGSCMVGLSLIACITVTVIICSLIRDDRQVCVTNKSFGEQCKSVGTGIVAALCFCGIALLKIVGWFITILILSWLVRWSWSCIGDGLLWSVIGVLVLMSTAPSLLGAVLKMLVFSWSIVPALVVACFEES